MRDELPLPSWVTQLLAPPVRKKKISESGLSIGVAETKRWTLASVAISNALELDALQLQRRTVEAYGLLQRTLAATEAPYPVRFWNFIPDIHSRLGEDIDRYMSFNAGRFAAYCDWFGGPEAFDQHVAAATGIGHDAPDLVIHVLAGREPGMHLHNPRQRRPYRYSRRYGPFPPCFARATVVRGAGAEDGLALVGGTASVLDESSVHINNVAAQLEETLHNLCRLLEAAFRAWRGVQAPRNTSALLCSFRSLRVYYVRPEDETWLRGVIARRIAHLRDIEFLHANVCRAELLVEIEGTAEL